MQSLTNQRTAFESAGYCEDGRVNNDADEYYDNHYFADEKISNGSAEAGDIIIQNSLLYAFFLLPVKAALHHSDYY